MASDREQTIHPVQMEAVLRILVLINVVCLVLITVYFVQFTQRDFQTNQNTKILVQNEKNSLASGARIIAHIEQLIEKGDVRGDQNRLLICALVKSAHVPGPDVKKICDA